MYMLLVGSGTNQPTLEPLGLTGETEANTSRVSEYMLPQFYTGSPEMVVLWVSLSTLEGVQSRTKKTAQ